MQERIRKSETIQSRVILPSLLNDHGILFGGIAMQWLDEVAYITATRFSRKRLVTVSVEKVNFILPVYSGMLIEIVGNITKVKSVKLEVKVELFAEEMYTEKKEKALEAIFTFAAVDKDHKPIPLLPDIYKYGDHGYSETENKIR